MSLWTRVEKKEKQTRLSLPQPFHWQIKSMNNRFFLSFSFLSLFYSSSLSLNDKCRDSLFEFRGKDCVKRRTISVWLVKGRLHHFFLSFFFCSNHWNSWFSLCIVCADRWSSSKHIHWSRDRRRILIVFCFVHIHVWWTRSTVQINLTKSSLVTMSRKWRKYQRY